MKFRDLIFGIISAFVVLIAAEVSFHDLSQTIIQGSSKHQTTQLSSAGTVIVLGENPWEFENSTASSEKPVRSQGLKWDSVLDPEFQKSQTAILVKSGCPIDARKRIVEQIHPFHFFW